MTVCALHNFCEVKALLRHGPRSLYNGAMAAVFVSHIERSYSMLLVDQTIHLKSALGHQFIVPVSEKHVQATKHHDIFQVAFSTTFEIGKHSIQVMSYQYSLQDEQDILLVRDYISSFEQSLTS